MVREGTSLVKWAESNTAKPRVSLKNIGFLANPLILKVWVGQGIQYILYIYIYDKIPKYTEYIHVVPY